MIRRAAFLGAALFAAAVSGAAAVPEVRIKDVARLRGVRENQLVGYGLVIGLAGTGDSNRSGMTIASIRSALERFGVRVPPGEIETKNMASVVVTATLPPFARSGDRIDVTVSAVGDAKSLQNGILLQTPLRAANGEIYAVAQGPISIGGGTPGGAAARAQAAAPSHPTVGRLPGGALIEREIRSDVIEPDGTIVYQLSRPDFTTASRLARSINDAFEPDIAEAVDAGTVRIVVPDNFRRNLVDFISKVEGLYLAPDAEARVVVNERTGTVVFGENVRVSEVAVTHASLSVQVTTEATPGGAGGLPGGGGGGATTLTVSEEGGNIRSVPAAATVRDVVRALNAVGAKPRDVIAILQAMAEAGAIHARIEVM